MPHDARFLHMRIKPVTAMIHVTMSVILITFASATYVFVHLRTLLVTATATFPQRSVLYFDAYMRVFYSSLNVTIYFNGLAASFSVDIGVTGMWNCCPSLI